MPVAQTISRCYATLQPTCLYYKHYYWRSGIKVSEYKLTVWIVVVKFFCTEMLI